MHKPELLAPIQDHTTLRAALHAGADAVFFGVRGFNMRVAAKNFAIEDLSEVTTIVHEAGAQAYLALNTIIYDDELGGMEEVVQAAHNAGIDAVICWDLSVIRACKRIGIPFHVSTQASIANSEAARFYKEIGAERVVLARECTLEQVRTIQEQANVEIEVFVHGAMCVSMSGRCFLSQFSTCKSANRGACLQPCRRNYVIKDADTGVEFEVGADHILSPQDLCTLPFLEELMATNVDCFKIEGRNKGPEYVADVTSVYREMIDLIWEHRDTLETQETQALLAERKLALMPKLTRVFNRGFSNGFYMGKPMNAWSNTSDNAATEKKVAIGVVTNYYKQAGAAEVRVEGNTGFQPGDTLLIQGPTTGHVRLPVTSIEVDHHPRERAMQGDMVAIACPQLVRTHDRVYVVHLHEPTASRHAAS